LSTLKRHASAEASVLQEKIDELCTDVRNMSHQLSPASLKIAGLRHLISELAEETKRTTGIGVDVQFYDWPADIPEEVAHHLFRVVQEAVSNAAKYAQATEIDLQFFKHQNELVVTIDDNGKGFDVSDAHKGIGLKNMQARVASLQGSLEISSDASHGTSILVKGIYLAQLE
jgi:signal transduction histidine kinase